MIVFLIVIPAPAFARVNSGGNPSVWIPFTVNRFRVNPVFTGMIDNKLYDLNE